jgi:hypothetical protein
MALAMIGGTACCRAQTATPVGTVSSSDAAVTGGAAAVVPAAGGRVDVDSGATVTANPGRNAEVKLGRGGSVLVCQTTGVHLTASGDSLQLALDRGAMEIRRKAGASDVILTPDLRFTLAEDAGSSRELDLRMRVTFNGDTCVENRGHKAPQLNVSDAFGEASYLLKPGQHVMFEHGSLKTVMDRETTPCGCPPEEKRPEGISLADAVLSGGQSTPVTPKQAAAEHPFPEAVSEGLAAPPADQPENPGERHVQVASTLKYDPNAPAEDKDSVASTAATVTSAPPPAPPAAQQKHGPFAAIGRFFQHLFAR